jgi:drug/metabolite transporter (DMT)-like permease
VLWSTAGLFVRLLELDMWTILGWRSLFAGLALALLVAVQSRGRVLGALYAAGWPGLVAIPMAVLSMGTYVPALKLTTVANVMIVYATVPFVAAGIAYAWIGERMAARALWASAIALVGIVIVAGAAPRPQDVAGNAAAFLMTVTFAVQLVMARRYKTLDMAPINAAAAFLCAALCWPLMAPEVPDARQLAILALFGITTTSMAYMLFLIGGRHVASSEAGLIGLLDVVLGPFWVWLFFAEQPGVPALIGGSLVLAAVAWYLATNRPPS